jgi:hypothetical protein
MLQKLLSSFSLNSLKTLAGKESLNFFEETLNISPDYYEFNSQSSFLTQAILNSNPLNIFLNKESRDYFIDRISSEDISSLILAINGEVQEDIGPQHYDAIKVFCNKDKHLKNFLLLQQ